MFPSYKRQAHTKDIIWRDKIVYIIHVLKLWILNIVHISRPILSLQPLVEKMSERWRTVTLLDAPCFYVFPCPSQSRIVDNGASLDRILFSESQQTESAASQEGRRLELRKVRTGQSQNLCITKTVTWNLKITTSTQKYQTSLAKCHFSRAMSAFGSVRSTCELICDILWAPPISSFFLSGWGCSFFRYRIGNSMDRYTPRFCPGKLGICWIGSWSFAIPVTIVETIIWHHFVTHFKLRKKHIDIQPPFA